MAIKVTHLEPEFKDFRGFISRVLDDKKTSIKSILYIERKKGTEGANHYHKKDTHYIFVISGKIKYYEKKINSKSNRIESVILNPGDMVLSKSMVAHSTDFLKDTVFLAFATEHRTQKQYEKDTVRIDFRKNEKK